MTDSALSYPTSRQSGSSAGSPHRSPPRGNDITTEDNEERPGLMENTNSASSGGRHKSNARRRAKAGQGKDRSKRERVAQKGGGTKSHRDDPISRINSDGTSQAKSKRTEQARQLEDDPSKDVGGTQENEVLDPFFRILGSLQNLEIGHGEAGKQDPDVYSEEPLPSSGSIRSAHEPRARRMRAYSAGSQSSLPPDSGWSSETSLTKGSGSGHRKQNESPPPVPPIPPTVPANTASTQQSSEDIQPINPEAKDIQEDIHARKPSDVESLGDDTAYPPLMRRILVLSALYMSVFLVALDKTIVGPAIPSITNQFDSIADIGWYGSAYTLTSCGFMLFFGQLYEYFATKYVFLVAIFFFEAGSLICATAQSSMMLIIGRAIQGPGTSGITTGAQVIIAHTLPLSKRPLALGLFGAVFGVASVSGPLLGGVFTSHLTWRWCFWINLPIGGLALLINAFYCPMGTRNKTMSWKRRLWNLDHLGTILLIGSLVCLILALQWTSSDRTWNNPSVIGLLAAFAGAFILFVLLQIGTQTTTATVKSRVIFQRSVAAGCISQFTIGAGMLTFSLYIPLWFQAIKEWDAIHSGYGTIPLVGSVVVGAIFSGICVQKVGYYTPFILIGSAMMAAGAGLITTWEVDTGMAKWASYQAIFGCGVGFAMQQTMLAAQTVLPMQDLPSGTALLNLCQALGGAVFASVGEHMFLPLFLRELKRAGVPNAEGLIKVGATELKDMVLDPKQDGAVLRAYNLGLTKGPFFAAMIVVCLAFPAACCIEWRSTKEKKESELPPPEERDIEEKGNSGTGASDSAFPPPIALQERAPPPRPPTRNPSSGTPSRHPSRGSKVPSRHPSQASKAPTRQNSKKSRRKSLPDASRSLAKKINPDLRDELGKRDPPEGWI